MSDDINVNDISTAPSIPTVYTVKEAMTECGVNDTDLFEGKTPAVRMAEDLFSNDFQTCMDKTHEELDSDFKTYSDLTQAQGQIRITPGIKKNIKAFLQWARDEYRLGRNPRYGRFDVNDTQKFMRRYKTHKQFIDKSSDVSDAAKPSKFTTKMRWSDWAPTFLNYLRTIPGRDGVPLNYVCRDSEHPNPDPHDDFIEDYVAMAPINQGEAFNIDTAEVHTLIVKFITGNDTAEMKIKAHEAKRDGRIDWFALKEHYEGVGIHAFDIHEAEAIIQDLYYSGEKYPHMYWEKFEQRLTHAFTTCEKVEGNVYTQNMKIRKLLQKIKADFLAPSKAGLNIELTKVPMTMTYDRALAIFRNEVNRKNPPQLSNNPSNRERRSLREVNTHDGKNRYRGRGRGKNNHGKGRGNWVQKTRSDSSIITLTDGQNIEYHPSFSFPSHVFQKMKQADKERLKRERAEYKNKRKASEISTTAPVQQVNADHATQVSQVTQGTVAGQSVASYPSGSTIMGGRNERVNTRN